MNSSGQNGGESSSSSICTSLILRIKERDPEAWRRMVRTYGPLIYQWCSRSGLGSQEAADIGQEVFRAVSDSIASFRRDRKGDTFVGWLRTITRYKIADYRRRLAKDPEAIGGTDFQIQVAQLPETQEVEQPEATDNYAQSLVFHRALTIIQSEFEPRTWRAFWATAVDERATRDVADDLGMTQMAVRKAKSRVLRRLRDEFEDDIPAD